MAISASTNRLFWKRADRLAEGRAGLAVLERRSKTVSAAATAPTAIDSRSCGRFSHQVEEALALLAEQVRRGHPDVVEEQLGGVLGLQADLVQVAAALEARHARARRRAG